MICNYSLLELINGPFYIAFDLFFVFTEKGSQGRHRKGRLTNESAGDSTRVSHTSIFYAVTIAYFRMQLFNEKY